MFDFSFLQWIAGIGILGFFFRAGMVVFDGWLTFLSVHFQKKKP